MDSGKQAIRDFALSGSDSTEIGEPLLRTYTPSSAQRVVDFCGLRISCRASTILTETSESSQGRRRPA